MGIRLRERERERERTAESLFFFFPLTCRFRRRRFLTFFSIPKNLDIAFFTLRDSDRPHHHHY
jgi:hypothetical protein